MPGGQPLLWEQVRPRAAAVLALPLSEPEQEVVMRWLRCWVEEV